MTVPLCGDGGAINGQTGWDHYQLGCGATGRVMQVVLGLVRRLLAVLGEGGGVMWVQPAVRPWYLLDSFLCRQQ